MEMLSDTALHIKMPRIQKLRRKRPNSVIFFRAKLEMSKNSGYAKMKCKDEVIRYNNNRSPIYNSPSRASLTTVESEVDVVDDALTLQRFQVEICNSNCYNLLISRVSQNKRTF